MASSAGEPSRSATTIVTMRSFHVIKIDGYSRSLNSHHSGRPAFNSSPFRAGGRTWHVSYRPMGSQHHPENTEFISFYLILDDIVDEAVVAQASFSLLNQDGSTQVHTYSLTTDMNNFSVSRDRAFGYERFIKRDDLEQSEYLKDDCFAIGVRVHIVKEEPSIRVPPSDMNQDLGDLLSRKEDTDVEFQVGGERFAAHRLMLGVRSPVLMAELFGSMKEGVTTNVIQVDDMEPRVFDVLLNFIYTDTWPEMEEEDASAMTQHLLVAADRYCLPRLKFMCEDKLRNHIDSGSVANILALAEQHFCPSLKEVCFKFLGSLTALCAVIETKDFVHLAQSCPTIMKELISILVRELEKAKVSGGVGKHD